MTTDYGITDADRRKLAAMADLHRRNATGSANESGSLNFDPDHPAIEEVRELVLQSGLNYVKAKHLDDKTDLSTVMVGRALSVLADGRLLEKHGRNQQTRYRVNPTMLAFYGPIVAEDI